MPLDCADAPCGHKRRDLTGVGFGRLTVVGEASSRRQPCGKLQRYWRCRCVCGKESEVLQANLNSGHTTSCGCRMRQLAEISMRCLNTRHGQSRTRLYGIWIAMRKRCEYLHHIHYASYGGRGISVCVRWLEFEAFRADMGEPPSDKHSIERKDNDLGYFPENCVWATATEQGRNKRNNHVIEYNGLRLTMADWSRRLEVSENTIRERLRRGWSLTAALSTPPKGR